MVNGRLRNRKVAAWLLVPEPIGAALRPRSAVTGASDSGRICAAPPKAARILLNVTAAANSPIGAESYAGCKYNRLPASSGQNGLGNRLPCILRHIAATWNHDAHAGSGIFYRVECFQALRNS
jgi:hypothetical protein